MARDSAENGPPSTRPPDSLVDILIARGAYEEGKIEEIKAAYDARDKDRVFSLVGELLYEGPGTNPDAGK